MKQSSAHRSGFVGRVRSALGGKRAKRIGKVLVVGVPLLVLFFSASVAYTSRPSFCTTCHYMEPFYTSWQSSSHADVTCVMCHFPPGIAGTIRGKMEGMVQVVNYLGRSYTRRKPWAEIEDASCLQSGCHAERTLAGTVTYKGVVFDHSSHLGELRRGKQLRCTSCHSQVVQGDHIVVTETTCFLCHMKRGEIEDEEALSMLGNCKTCHDWTQVPAEERAHFRYDHSDAIAKQTDCAHCHSRTVEGTGSVSIDHCSTCHFEQERLDEFDNPELLHRVHIAQHKIECVQCHVRIEHRIQRFTAESELNCSICHTSTHKEQLLLFTGSPVTGVDGPGNPMFDVGLNCESCHVKHQEARGLGGVMLAEKKACVDCHGEGYDRLVTQWERSADGKLVRFRADLSGVQQAINAAGGSRREGVQQALDDARTVLETVQIGKAVHNPKFANELFRHGYERLDDALKASGAVFALPTVRDTPVPSDCANCHAGLETLSVPYKSRTFPHATHSVQQNLSCKSCHSNEVRHGQLVMPTQRCNSCHHAKSRQDQCETCHSTAFALYAGSYEERNEADVMAEAEVGCTDCHVSKGNVLKPTTSVCLDCHDEGYDEMGSEWISEVRGEIASLETMMRSADRSVQATEEFRRIRSVLNDLVAGSGSGAHNYILTTDVLAELKASLKQIQASN